MQIYSTPSDSQFSEYWVPLRRQTCHIFQPRSECKSFDSRMNLLQVGIRNKIQMERAGCCPTSTTPWPSAGFPCWCAALRADLRDMLHVRILLSVSSVYVGLELLWIIPKQPTLLLHGWERVQELHYSVSELRKMFLLLISEHSRVNSKISKGCGSARTRDPDGFRMQV